MNKRVTCAATVLLAFAATLPAAGQLIGTSPPRARVNTVVFSPDGEYMAFGQQDNTIRLWNVVKGSEEHRFDSHTHWVISLAFSPDGTRLASGSRD